MTNFTTSRFSSTTKIIVPYIVKTKIYHTVNTSTATFWRSHKQMILNEWSFHMKFMNQATIKFMRNDHGLKILLIIWAFPMWFYRLQREQYINLKTHYWHGRCHWRYVCAQKCQITRVLIQILGHDVIHWITATSCEKSNCTLSRWLSSIGPNRTITR